MKGKGQSSEIKSELWELIDSVIQPDQALCWAILSVEALPPLASHLQLSPP